MWSSWWHEQSQRRRPLWWSPPTSSQSHRQQSRHVQGASMHSRAWLLCRCQPPTQLLSRSEHRAAGKTSTGRCCWRSTAVGARVGAAQRPIGQIYFLLWLLPCCHQHIHQHMSNSNQLHVPHTHQLCCVIQRTPPDAPTPPTTGAAGVLEGCFRGPAATATGHQQSAAAVAISSQACSAAVGAVSAAAVAA